LASKGAEITSLLVNSDGQLDLAEFSKAIKATTRLIVVMLANNETGVIHPLKDIYEIAQAHGIPLFSDATQAVGKVMLKAADTADILCFSAHKMYGPKGAGALYINKKRKYALIPQLHGGGHERTLRSGTVNVPAIVGFGKAAGLASETLLSESSRLQVLRDTLENELGSIPNVQINGRLTSRLSHVSNITFTQLPNTDLLKLLSHQIAVSTGSACSAVVNKPSHVLTAMGISPLNALNSIRFSLGKYTTLEEIQITITEVKKVLARIGTR
jgi:cysteine desulfurase